MFPPWSEQQQQQIRTFLIFPIRRAKRFENLTTNIYIYIYIMYYIYHNTSGHLSPSRCFSLFLPILYVGDGKTVFNWLNNKNKNI